MVAELAEHLRRSGRSPRHRVRGSAGSRSTTSPSCDNRLDIERLFEYDEEVPDSPLALAHRLLAEAVDALAAATGPAAGDAELISVLTLGEGTARGLDRVVVGALADLERRGTFAGRGYRSTPSALGDLLGWERADAKRRLTAAEQIRPRIGLDGALLPPRLPATAEAFDAGSASLRHVEVVTRVLGSDAARRLTPQVWAGAEAQLAGWIPDCAPGEVQMRGTQLVDALDADGPEPDDRPRVQVNELHLLRNPDGPGGRLAGRYDDAAMFDAIASVVDAGARPRTADDDRTPAARQAEALADACGFVLDHGTSEQVPATGGRRPHLNVLVALDDLSAAPAPRCSTSAAPCRRSRCGCSPATPPSSRSSWAAPDSPSTSAAAPESSPRACAAPSPPATAAAPAAAAPRAGRRSTTSCRGSITARRASTTA